MGAAETLFLVDDDDIFVFLTMRVIKETKMAKQVKVFTNGKTALDSLKELIETNSPLPEIILLDLNMPVLDGWGFLSEYQVLQPASDKKIQIFLVTSSISPRDMEKANTFPVVSDFIVKPLERDRFESALRNIHH